MGAVIVRLPEREGSEKGAAGRRWLLRLAPATRPAPGADCPAARAW